MHERAARSPVQLYLNNSFARIACKLHSAALWPGRYPLSGNGTNIFDHHAAASCHQHRVWQPCPLQQAHNTMKASILHSSTAGVGKRFAALKKAFQRATGTGFTEMSQKACLPTL